MTAPGLGWGWPFSFRTCCASAARIGHEVVGLHGLDAHGGLGFFLILQVLQIVRDLHRSGLILEFVVVRGSARIPAKLLVGLGGGDIGQIAFAEVGLDP